MARHTTVSLEEIAGVVPQLDDTDKLAVSLYGQNSSAGDTVFEVLTQGVDANDNGKNQLIVNARPSGFNGTTWDRQRNNEEMTLLASAARTASTSSAEQTNYNARGVIITVRVESITDTPSVVPSIVWLDPAANWAQKVLEAPAIVSTGAFSYILYPGVASAAEDVDYVRGYPLGRAWRLDMTHADTDSITYRVGCSYIL